MHRYRTHTCDALRESDIGVEVRLSGWCHRIRDHGGLLFIDLRDHYGITQVVADPDSPAFKAAEKLRSEWVVRIDGKVRKRPEGTVNPELPTGAVEVFISEIEVLSAAGELPLPVFGEQEYPEEIRLKYRFLDLRRDRLHANIMKRGRIIESIRRRMREQGFVEFQTPILTASSPEGARDFLVPSRLHPGKFYALPQAPQQFKQLVMISGFDRYFQIAPCFRDEDARADRSPGEFYQLDVEMSFVTQEEVFAAVEPVLRGVFEEFAEGKPVTPKFPRIAYGDAVRQYGTDKPDLRNPVKLQNVTSWFSGSAFRVFANQIAADPEVEIWAIPAPKGGSRAFCDRMNEWAKTEGQPGLGYIFWREGEETGAGPIARNLGPERTEGIRTQLGLGVGDAVFFAGGRTEKFVQFAGIARNRIGNDLDLIEKNRFEFCWIVDFPMYGLDQEEKKIEFSHNPFSMPNMEAEEFLNLDPADHDTVMGIKAIQYDIVCNGVELSSGAIRNHRPDVMRKAFAIAGYDESVLEQKFGGMLRALSYGAPPHGGIAPGIDRIVMLLCGEENLREVVLFPMNQRAEDLLMGAPSEVSPKQLRELHIRLALPDRGTEVERIESAHPRLVGSIVTNLQALETHLRYFLLKASNQYVSFPMPGDKEVAENYLTTFISLGDLVNTYNAGLGAGEEKFRLDETVVRIRDAIAHGRLVTATVLPATLWKFGRAKSGRVPVEFSETLTREWLIKMSNLIDAERQKVLECFAARKYEGLR
jgi:aspartyl-tRNA synthetase